MEILLNAILLKYAGIVVPIGGHDEAREEYHAIIHREVDPKDGVTCHWNWSSRPFERTLEVITRYIVQNRTEVGSIIHSEASEKGNLLSEHEATSTAMTEACKEGRAQMRWRRWYLV